MAVEVCLKLQNLTQIICTGDCVILLINFVLGDLGRNLVEMIFLELESENLFWTSLELKFTLDAKIVQVCDFGLSRLKHSTFLSSKSTAGTVSHRHFWFNIVHSCDFSFVCCRFNF